MGAGRLRIGVDLIKIEPQGVFRILQHVKPDVAGFFPGPLLILERRGQKRAGVLRLDMDMDERGVSHVVHMANIFDSFQYKIHFKGMKTFFSPSSSLSVFFGSLSEFMEDPDVGSVMILSADGNGWDVDAANEGLRNQSKPFFGGVFPRILYGKASYESGFVLAGFPQGAEVQVIEGVSDEASDYEPHLLSAANAWDSMEGEQTLLVFVDGLSSRIAALVRSLFYSFGLRANFVGGGAGSLSFEQKPCLLCEQGMIQDAALLVRLPMPSGVGVAHGWEPISDAMKVTAAEGNLIRSLDWEPAFERYRGLVEPHAGREFTADNFFEIAKGYPFGIGKVGAEVVVRDPLQTRGEGLVCVGEVPKGSFVRLLHGTPETLVKAAAGSLSAARASYPKRASPPRLALFIDCISRALFLEERLPEELEAVVCGETPLVGAMTLGEIANSGRDYLEFFNKTAVMCLLGPEHESEN